MYDLPDGCSVCDGLFSLFSHYCSPWRSNVGKAAADPSTMMLESLNFARLCKDVPGLDKLLTRGDVDLIFSKAKPLGSRRLDFEHFLVALLEMSIELYPEDDPTTALTKLLVEYMFGVFEETRQSDEREVFDKVYNELTQVM